MRQVRFSAAMSLDGFIAGPNGEYDWIVMDPDINFAELFENFDTVLMGRRSYEVMLDQPEHLPKMPTYVFSRTLSQSDCPDVVVSADLKQTVIDLKAESGKDIWLFGGGELFRSLLALDLVDAIEVAIVPILLGAGIPMLPHPATMTKLTLIRNRVYEKTGTLLLEYVIARDTSENQGNNG